MLTVMSKRTKLTESAPDSEMAEAQATEPTEAIAVVEANPEANPENAAVPAAEEEPYYGRRRRRRGPAAPPPKPEASEAEVLVAEARQLLERLVRGAGFGWRDIDRLIHKNRGFTAHLMAKREGMPLTELLQILDAIHIKYEDFFAVLLPGLGKARHKKRIGANMTDLLGEAGVPEVPVETEADQDERARVIWGQMDKINALIDQRVLALMEQAFAAVAPLPPRPEAVASAEAAPADAPVEGQAASAGGEGPGPATQEA